LLQGGPIATSGFWKAPDIVPSIAYSDLPSAVEWFERVFGFRERADARLTWSGGGTTWIEVGGSLFNIAAPSGPPQEPGIAVLGLVMKVYVDDVDLHFAHAQSEGAMIISGLENGFWGGRFYRALDHEGHVWEISHRGQDVAPERWELPPGMTRGCDE